MSRTRDNLVTKIRVDSPQIDTATKMDEDPPTIVNLAMEAEPTVGFARRSPGP
jgi:hypothetical protein